MLNVFVLPPLLSNLPIESPSVLQFFHLPVISNSIVLALVFIQNSKFRRQIPCFIHSKFDSGNCIIFIFLKCIDVQKVFLRNKNLRTFIFFFFFDIILWCKGVQFFLAKAVFLITFMGTTAQYIVFY